MSFLFVDRILESHPGFSVKGVKQVTDKDLYLSTDAQGKPCFVPSLIGETLGQLAAWHVMQQHDFTLRPVAGVVASTQVHRSVYVGETLLLESHIDVLDDKAVQYHGEAKVGDALVFSLDGAIGPLLPMADFIGIEQVKEQFASIYKPGPWPFFEDSLVVSRESGHQKPSLIFDTVLTSEPGISLVAQKKVVPEAAYFSDHFPNRPVLPMTVLLECKINLAKDFVAQAGFENNYEVSALRKIKMNTFVSPGEVVTTTVKVKEQTPEQLVLSYRSDVDGNRVCIADIVLLAKE